MRSVQCALRSCAVGIVKCAVRYLSQSVQCAVRIAFVCSVYCCMCIGCTIRFAVCTISCAVCCLTATTGLQAWITRQNLILIHANAIHPHPSSSMPVPSILIHPHPCLCHPSSSMLIHANAIHPMQAWITRQHLILIHANHTNRLAFGYRLFPSFRSDAPHRHICNLTIPNRLAYFLGLARTVHIHRT